MIRAASELTRDLVTPSARVYWTDFLASAVVGYAGVAVAILAPSTGWMLVASLVAVLALYRAGSFIHELTHIRKNALPGFRFVWNLLVGIKDALALIFLLMFFALLFGLLAGRPNAALPVSEGALLIDFKGVVSEQPSDVDPLAALSGGNQQKVVLGKSLLCQPRVILLDEPTRGVDVGAKQEIYALLSELRREGLGVLMVSSDLPELLGMSDRVLVLSDGTLTANLTAKQATPEALLQAALAKTVEQPVVNREAQ